MDDSWSCYWGRSTGLTMSTVSTLTPDQNYSSSRPQEASLIATGRPFTRRTFSWWTVQSMWPGLTSPCSRRTCSVSKWVKKLYFSFFCRSVFSNVISLLSRLFLTSFPLGSLLWILERFQKKMYWAHLSFEMEQVFFWSQILAGSEYPRYRNIEFIRRARQTQTGYVRKDLNLFFDDKQKVLARKLNSILGPKDNIFSLKLFEMYF